MSLLSPLIVLGQINDPWIIGDTLIETAINNSEITLRNVELYWSADTYVPFNYQGRALPVKNSFVTIDVYLEISGENPKNLKYSWFLDGFFQESKSGYGKDSFRFGVRKTKGDSHEVLVKIFNESRSFLIERTIKTPIAEPEIVVSPLSENSIFSKIITVLSGKEISFIAKPYFFSIDKLANLTFNWQINGQQPTTSSDYGASILNLTIPEKKGTKLLEKELQINVTNRVNSGQRASQKIKLQIY